MSCAVLAFFLTLFVLVLLSHWLLSLMGRICRYIKNQYWFKCPYAILAQENLPQAWLYQVVCLLKGSSWGRGSEGRGVEAIQESDWVTWAGQEVSCLGVGYPGCLQRLPLAQHRLKRQRCYHTHLLRVEPVTRDHILIMVVTLGLHLTRRVLGILQPSPE